MNTNEFDPSRLYHYTTMETFYAMIEESLYPKDEITKTHLIMWATHCYYLNDPTENRLWLQNVKVMVSEYAKEQGTTISKEQFSIIDMMLDKAYSYIISFSSKNDDLGMWRGYGQNGNGICLWFDFSGLNLEAETLDLRSPTQIHANTIADENIIQPSDIKKCIYKSADIDAEVIKYIYDNLINNTDFSKVNVLGKILDNSSRYKHYKYEAEDEIRIVKNKLGNIKYRENGAKQVPYYEIKVPISCLKEVMIGPCINSEISMLRLKTYLSQKLLGDINVTLSEIPYRDRL